jgi:EAL domain-containing protein (putative c-di-GMP-specific phosphodiesterase class I)
MVFRIIEDVGIPASNLEMELTESILVGDIGASITIMKALRDFGIRLSIDDFGTGYSSLNYLKSFPLHKLKVDQSFVRGLHTSSEDAAITQTIVTLGHTLGLKVIAEGIETQEHLSKLAGYGCEYMQGYLISRPRPSQDFAIWHDQWVSKPLH